MEKPANVSDLRAYVLCRFAENSGVYSSWLNRAPFATTVVDEYLPDWKIPEDAGILITHMHYRWEELSTLRSAHQRHSVPILILSDGILEYRNTWEHPNLVDGSMFQPLFGDKLACIGRGQARVVESWGNPGQCEVVGLPRLDAVDAAAIPAVQKTGPFRVLIASANTPAFNDTQRESVVESLRQIKHWVESNSVVNQRPLTVSWRLSDGLESEIGLAKEWGAAERPPLTEALEGVDAVITTPSTLYLESVLRGRPTAILDFHASPQYVTAAWTIGSPQGFGRVMSELESPAGHKMGFQNFVLHDQLECRTPATPRLFQLVEGMVDAGERARSAGQNLELPARMLADECAGFSTVPQGFDLSTLYPSNEAFIHKDRQRLQVELAAAIKRLDQLPLELAEKNRYIASLKQSLDRSRDRNEEMHNRVVSLRRRLGVEPNGPEGESCDPLDQG